LLLPLISGFFPVYQKVYPISHPNVSSQGWIIESSSDEILTGDEID
jgi:hypothetical protein